MSWSQKLSAELSRRLMVRSVYLRQQSFPYEELARLPAQPQGPNATVDHGFAHSVAVIMAARAQREASSFTGTLRRNRFSTAASIVSGSRYNCNSRRMMLPLSALKFSAGIERMQSRFSPGSNSEPSQRASAEGIGRRR